MEKNPSIILARKLEVRIIFKKFIDYIQHLYRGTKSTRLRIAPFTPPKGP